MAPRRGGAGGAGAEAASGAGRQYFDPPPLKRLSPWKQDGSDSCDILAGGVDETGIYKGVYVSGVHLCALIRTFQLSKVFIPVDMPTPVAALGQALEDGIPLVIVTRGAFGRELDYGAGPVRNDIQKAVWQACRDMRAEMPQVLITCIDVPANLGADWIQGCLDEPLNQYRELMFQDGTWYTPSVTNASSLGKWAAENTRQRAAKKGGTIQFNRKKFDWTNTHAIYGNIWYMGWKEVLQVSAPMQVPRRTDLDFSNRVKSDVCIINTDGPSGAFVTLKKAVDQAGGNAALIREAVKAYVRRARSTETASLREAVQICEETGDFLCMSEAVGILISMGAVEDAMAAATKLKGDAKTAVSEASALRLVVGCHRSTGDLDAALEAAKAGRASIESKSDEEATADVVALHVEVLLAKGEVDDAIAEATKVATEAKGKRIAAAAYLAAGDAHVAKGNAGDAANAQKKAAANYKELNMKKDAARALEKVVYSLLATEACGDAAAVARDIVALGAGDAVDALGKQLLAVAHLQEFATAQKYLDGGEAEVLDSAREAVALFGAASDFKSRTTAQQILANVLLVTQSDPAEGQQFAQAAVAGFRSLGGGPGLVSTLINGAQAAFRKGNLNSAYWSAKQAVVEADINGDQASKDIALGVMAEVSRMSDEKGKPMQCGGPVPLVVGSDDAPYITFV